MTFHNISLRISNSNSKYTLKIFSDRAAMTRVAMGAAVATEVDREVMGVVDTKMSPSKAMYSTNAEHQVFSMCFVTTIKQFPYLNYSHLLLYRHLLPTLADLQLISH